MTSSDATLQTVAMARQDLRARTLDPIAPGFTRLLYLASTRDYNSGQYFHDGLAMRFTESVAAEALETEHLAIFDEIAMASLEITVAALRDYFRSTAIPLRRIIHTWNTLDPYRVVVPARAHPLAVKMFLSNIKIALEILEKEASEQN